MTKRILLDMDGVIADFVAGAAALHGRDPASVVQYDMTALWGISANKFWAPMGRDFWASLPLTPEALSLMAACEAAVGPENICFLTSPCLTDGCIDGKLDWVKKHFPAYARRVLVGPAKYFCASATSLLIDDHEGNTDVFIDYGGKACLFPRPWNRCAKFSDSPLTFARHYIEEFCNG